LESQWDHTPHGVVSNIYQTGKTLSSLLVSWFMFFFFLMLSHVKTLLLHLTSKPFSRLAGVAFVVPTVNYWWPSLPDSLIREDYRRKLVQWSIWFANYAPGLVYWWATQKWLPSTSGLERNPLFFNDRDIDILKTISGFPMLTKVIKMFHPHKSRKEKGSWSYS
jgi:hypothetical protein